MANPGIAYKIKTICRREGQHWSTDGSLHAQSLGIVFVRTTIPAAMREPTNQEALKSDVMIGLNVYKNSELVLWELKLKDVSQISAKW